jgi:hypothetical protein
MAKEIQIAYGVTGRTLYAVIRTAVGTVWNTSTSLVEAYNAADWTNYAVPVTEQGSSGYYTGNFPSPAAGVYHVEIRDQSGGAPSTTDPIIGSGDVDWTGFVVGSLSAVQFDTGQTFSGVYSIGSLGQLYKYLISNVGSTGIKIQGVIQTLDALWANFVAYLSGSSIRLRVMSPLSPTGREMELYVGDAYTDDTGNPVTFGFTGAPDITGKVCTLGIGKPDVDILPLQVLGTIVASGSSGTQVVKFQLTQAQTLLLAPDEIYQFNFAVDYTSSTPPKPRTIVAGQVITRRKWSD